MFNHQGSILHQHCTLAEQLAGKCCSLHPDRQSCKIERGQDFMVIGAPCNPFSIQRAGRFEESSVQEHQLYGLTFDGVVEALKRFAPVSAVMETTDGFCKPMQKNSSTTPLLKQLGCRTLLNSNPIPMQCLVFNLQLKKVDITSVMCALLCPAQRASNSK